MIGDLLAQWLYYNQTTLVEILIIILTIGTLIYCVDTIKKSWGDRRVLIDRKAPLPERRQAQRELRTALGRAFTSSVFLVIAGLSVYTPARIPPTAASLFTIGLLTFVVSTIAYLQYADNWDRKMDLAELREEQRERESRIAGVIVIDRYNIIHQFNAAAELIFGYPAEKVLGQSLAMLIPEWFQDAHLRGLARAYEDTEPSARVGAILDLPGLRADGSETPLHIVLHELNGATGKMFMAVFTVNPLLQTDDTSVDVQRHRQLLDEQLLNTRITIEAKNSSEKALDTANHINEKINLSLEVGNKAVESLRLLVVNIEEGRKKAEAELAAAIELARAGDLEREEVHQDREDARSNREIHSREVSDAARLLVDERRDDRRDEREQPNVEEVLDRTFGDSDDKS